MKTTRTFDFPLRWAALGLVTGLLLLSGVAVADDFPATGQTTCYDSAGMVIACAGTGQDGEIQAGRTLRYKDNGNGTITDRNTRLVWEKKDDNNVGGIHDQDNTYTWDDAFAVHVATLNNTCANDETVDCSANGKADCAGVGGKCGFAGKRDWRVPNVKELPSIVNYENFFPAVSPAFNTNCVADATVLTGSCTAVSGDLIGGGYWSSSSQANGVSAWLVNFVHGHVGDVIIGNLKSEDRHVRAVRGGSELPATGQTTCYDSAGMVIACAGTGQDGDIQAGKTLRYKDNGNGTIKDKVTELTWEKKSDDDGIHDKDNRYLWDDAFAVHVATLNNTCANDETVDCSANGNADCAGVGGKCGFAGKRDWRVPNVKELPSIVNYDENLIPPAVSAAFNTNCVAGATVLTGSCTAANYWSSTSVANQPSIAWTIDFGSLGGTVRGPIRSSFFKTLIPTAVRAVRGGSR